MSFRLTGGDAARKPIAALVGVVLLLGLMTGCAQAPAAEPILGSDCSDPNRDSYTVPLTPLPATTVLVEVTRCTFGNQLVPGDGEWVVRTDQRATTGLDALADALRLPSQARRPGTTCPAIGYLPIVLTATDTAGNVLHPAVPTDVCNAPLPAALAAIDALDWVTTATTNVLKLD